MINKQIEGENRNGMEWTGKKWKPKRIKLLADGYWPLISKKEKCNFINAGAPLSSFQLSLATFSHLFSTSLHSCFNIRMLMN